MIFWRSMNSLWKTILDGLTFKDLAGKRQPRTYTLITGLILLLLLMAGGMAGLNRYLLMSRVQATPVSVIVSTQTIAPTEPEAVSTTIPSTDCPIDSAEWSFTPTMISKNYQVIQPACVYEGLEKTIAWALAVREGYSRAEATEQLGFVEMPMSQLEHVEALGNQNEPQTMPVSFIPTQPDFKEWHVDGNGSPTITYALRGCFRTSTIVGNKVEMWGGDYSVICVVIEDAEGTQIVYALNNHIFTSTATPIRSYLLFGYSGEGLWLWLGTRENPKLPIDNPTQFAKDRLTIATLYDSQPWDMQWLKNTYSLSMQPLPEDWQHKTDTVEQQAILAALNGSGAQ
jgi:hypothetical protein